jgi:hypothetical protein
MKKKKYLLQGFVAGSQSVVVLLGFVLTGFKLYEVQLKSI